MMTNEAVLLTFSLVILFLYWRLHVYKRRKSREYIHSKNLPRLLFERSFFSYVVRTVCLVSSWIFLVLSFSVPVEISSEPPKTQNVDSASKNVDEIAFVLDLSSSMLAQDSSIGISRLDRAKEIIQSVVENLGGINCSLMGFTSSDQMLVPDTLDYLFFRIMLDGARVNDPGNPGTNLLAMAESVRKKYAASPYQKSVLIVLLTDGEDTGFIGLDPQAKAQAERALLQAVAVSATQQLKWNVIGLGTSSGSLVPKVTFEAKPVVSKLQTNLLEQLAKQGRGHYFAESETSLSELVDNILAQVAIAQADTLQQKMQPKSLPNQATERFVLLILSALFLLIGICLPQNKARAL